MNFGNPIAFLALFGVLLLAMVQYLGLRASRARLRDFASAELLPSLTASLSPLRRRWKHGVVLVAFLFLVIALARPQWDYEWEEVEAQGRDVVFALDTSRSMLATDIQPDRMTRAKLAVLDLIEKLDGDRVGLVAFAGSAFLTCPLTLDYDAFRQTLQALDTDAVGRGGTDLAGAIAEAEAAFSDGEGEKIVILLTDGEDLEARGLAQARAASDAGVRLFTVGVGSAEGTFVPAANAPGEVIRDASGNPVISRLDEGTLQAIAQTAGGFYTPLGVTGEGLQRVYEEGLEGIEQTQGEASLRQIPIERFAWPLGFAIALLMIEPFIGNRRRPGKKSSAGRLMILPWLLTFLLAGSLLAPEEASAASPREAAERLQAGEFDEAVTLYEELVESNPEDPRLRYNLGRAQIDAGLYEQATVTLEETIPLADLELQRDIYYNLGWLAWRRGEEVRENNQKLARERWEEARTHFATVTEIAPEDTEAMHNSELLTRKLAALPLFELTLTSNDPDGGSVTGAGIYERGELVEIMAEASDGWTFLRWEGEGTTDTDSAKTTVTMDQSYTLQATFVPLVEITVQVEPAGAGTAGPSGEFPVGEPLEIEAVSNFGWRVEEWVGLEFPPDPNTGESTEPTEPTEIPTRIQVIPERDVTLTVRFSRAHELVFIPEEEANP